MEANNIELITRMVIQALDKIEAGDMGDISLKPIAEFTPTNIISNILSHMD